MYLNESVLMKASTYTEAYWVCDGGRGLGV